MKKCERCGKEIKSQEEREEIRREARKAGKRWTYAGSYCDGLLTMGTDPFAEEIHGDFSEYEDCEGSRYESMMDI